MNHARQSGRISRDDDKKFDFVSPNARADGRSASHRYFPVEAKAGNGGSGRGRADDFSSQDFKARWWPAPDMGK